MKKITWLLLLLAAFQLHAQEFHLIPKVGLNLAKMTYAEAKMKPGLNIGIAGEIKLNKSVALEPGLFYSMQGTKETEDGATGKIKNDYIVLPVLFKGYLHNGLHAFVGPQFGFRVSSKLSMGESGTTVSVDAGDYFNSFDFSFAFGVGYQFDPGLLISLGYNLGLTNMIKNDKFEEIVPAIGDTKIRNSVLQLNMGWRF